ncbi:formate/nitrite transporter family protein [Oerskovia sp. M15]
MKGAESLREPDRAVPRSSHQGRGRPAPWRYLVAAMLAGAYIGVGVVLMVATAGPFLAAALQPSGSWRRRLLGRTDLRRLRRRRALHLGHDDPDPGAVTRTIPVRSAAGTLLFCFGGNLLGSMLFGWTVVRSGVLHTNAAAGEMIASMLAGKVHETGGQLFFRGVLCNVLVCAAIWACGRLRSEAGRAVVIFWAIFAFISSGFEHVVANMTTFSIGLFGPEALTTWSEFGRNLLFVGLGNLVGERS